jgi:glycosyltransferase involved in cell wall biosynthesis
MRIAFLSVSDQLGGSEIALLELLRGIRAVRPGWSLDVILPGHGPLHARAAALGARCTVVALPAALARIGESSALRRGWGPVTTVVLGARLCAVAAAWPAYERRLRARLADIQPHVLHTNGLKAHVAGARAARPATALVWHMHEYVGTRPVTRALLRKHAGRCRAIVANSASVAHDVAAVIGPTPVADVVHNAVDLDTFAPAGPRADLDALAGLPAAPAGTVRVGLVATFSRWKGHDVFLRALAALPREVPVRGYVIGGPLYDTVGSQYALDELRQLASDLGTSVGFTGFVDGAAAIRALDIVVHASTQPEPFGLVIAEAMACGRPLITSAYGGAAELVTPGVDAVVHPPGDVAAVSSAIATLAASATLRQQYGERARAAAMRRFDPRRFATAMAAIYERAAADAPRQVRRTA